MANITLQTLNTRKSNGERFAMLTAYDASFARQISSAGVEMMLIGDSLGMVLQGNDSTLPVTMDDMVYHTRAVARGNQGAMIMADLPFMAYATPEQAMENAARLMAAGAHIVKLEGGRWLCETVAMLEERGIPTCPHLGLTPQSVNKFGGYRVQGREQSAATVMIEDAGLLEEAGASMLLLECVPHQLATQITQNAKVPVIGIGAGPNTDGQVLVMHDMLGVTFGKTPRFSKNFLADAGSIQEAFSAYAAAVRDGSFPTLEQSFE